jgi:hypothetical protein
MKDRILPLPDIKEVIIASIVMKKNKIFLLIKYKDGYV